MKHLEIHVDEQIIKDGVLWDLCKPIDHKGWSALRYVQTNGWSTDKWMIKYGILQDLCKWIDDRVWSALRSMQADAW